MQPILCFLVIAAVVGCSPSPERRRCQQAVPHVIRMAAGNGPISDGERAVIAAAEKASIERCSAEGLSEDQLRCILAVGSPDELLTKLPSCPAIVAKRPSWLTVPPHPLPPLPSTTTTGSGSSSAPTP